MRLLNVENLTFAEFQDDKKRPSYVIASHRWLKDGEATFQDVRDFRNVNGEGYQKVKAFAEYIKSNIPHVEWLWMDTCCINKESAAELSEAINTMFEWYHNAELCLAYLADVKTGDGISSFEQSVWFERGWTLQELLAPQTVVFVTKGWQVIGHKGDSTSNKCRLFIGCNLGKRIAQVTGIPEEVLYNYEASAGLSVDDNLKWMKSRKTTKPEDMSYALYGILGVTLGANYGEKHAGARQRLMAAIHQRDNLAIQHAKQYREIADWLSPPDPWTNHESARQRHEPQTGAWLLRHDKYLAWKYRSTRVFWVHGKAGCGKTVLCSTAIEDIRTHCQNASNVGYAIFYFSFSDNHKQTYQNILVSLVVQLGRREPGLSMLRQAYEKAERRLPGPDELQKILLSSLASYDQVYLHLDALDECPESDGVRQNALNGIGQLLEQAPNVRMLVTSRDVPDLQTLKKSKSTRPKSVEAALLTLPKDLDETYERMLNNIDQDDRPYAFTFLRWLAYAQSPPSLGELAEASIVDPTDDQTADGIVDVENRGGWGDTLEILAGLVMVGGADNGDIDDETARSDALDDSKGELSVTEGGQRIHKDSKVRLAHFSVKEYLESSRILASDAKAFHLDPNKEHRFLTQSCLVYLVHYSSSSRKTSTKQDLAAFPLLAYAAKSWAYHASLQQCSGSTRELSLLTSEVMKREWLLVHSPDQLWKGSFETPEGTIGTALYYASLLSIETAVQGLLSAGADINAQGGIYGNALQAASYGGYEKVVQMLMDAGADVNAQGGDFGNALQAASAGGDEKVVQMLMDAGADVNAQGGQYGNALQAASRGGHEKVVQMLMDAGADPKAKGGGQYGNALQAASRGGHEKVVQMLMDAGADVNAQRGHYGNALVAASRGGHEKVVQMLMDAGADPKAKGGGQYGNALQAASEGGHEKVVQMLMDVGADVNAQGGQCANALQAASFEGHEKVVQMLMDAGADVNAQRGHYGNALQAASFEGHEKVVQMLMDAGANVNAQGRFLGNALTAASYGGHEKVVQMLMDAGADVNAQGGDFGNALQAASEQGHEKVVHMLIDGGEDINAQGGQYGNALQAASAGGDEKVVQMLMDAGADVNAQGGQYGNALQAASYGGHEKVVQMLLDARADVNAQGGRGGNALQAASKRGHEKVVQMLMDAAADHRALISI
ncbi:hypothetical protein B0A48_18692 [Cryoendolithus antarcticus]|uniref:NACHT domain-containing protein n=1 Tax=Cryoendolithus antarcticus TaxID=1507870 RepID=A0A1V8S8W7_9PEZI|nr:hypothetical protein B0A48_18692 [Cryoendolithus antarcticus]